MLAGLKYGGIAAHLNEDGNRHTDFVQVSNVFAPGTFSQAS
jgi:hypothetical protein